MFDNIVIVIVIFTMFDNIVIVIVYASHAMHLTLTHATNSVFSN